MNVYDSQRIAALLTSSGLTISPDVDDAEWVILNTCNIRHKAAEKVYSEIGKLRNHRARIIVAGCVAQAEGAQIFERSPNVAAVVGPQALQRLPDIIAGLQTAAREQAIALAFEPEEKFHALPPADSSDGTPRVTAFLTVQEGCDKFCSFCVVPYTRGPHYARSVAGIVDEARRLSAAGIREITLLGQNVSAWRGRLGDRDVGFGTLLMELAAGVPEICRWRYTTSHPNDIDDLLIAAHRDLGKLMPWLHLPVQSGSDRILRAMNRRHSVADYERIIGRLREACPQLAFSSDFIVAYPSESAQDFDQTLALIRRVGFANSYAFVYSPRPGTPAARQDLPEPLTAKKRLQELLTMTDRMQNHFNSQKLGMTLPVLIERQAGEKEKGDFVGKTPWMQSCQVSRSQARAEIRPGDEINVYIAGLTAHGVTGYAAA